MSIIVFHLLRIDAYAPSTTTTKTFTEENDEREQSSTNQPMLVLRLNKVKKS